MKKFLAAISMGLFSLNAFAANPDFDTIFKSTSGCFILYDIKQQTILKEYNPTRCNERVSPASTFKVPLSLMAFEQNVITQKTVFKWDGIDKGLPQWNQNQTPASWLKNSVVWVSQEITPQLGLRKIEYYLLKFHYGNQDFSGDPYKHNGLTHAWLDSSLKISGEEQFSFMKALVENTLPISPDAAMNTKQNMFLETLPNGTKLYGKTGSTSNTGWFIGYTQKTKPSYIIILNFTDLRPTQNSVPAGTRAKTMVKNILSTMKLS